MILFDDGFMAEELQFTYLRILCGSTKLLVENSSTNKYMATFVV